MSIYQSYSQYPAVNGPCAYIPGSPNLPYASYPGSDVDDEDAGTFVEIEPEPTFWQKLWAPFKRGKCQCRPKGITTYQVGGKKIKQPRREEQQRPQPTYQAQAAYTQSYAQGPHPGWQPTGSHPQAPAMPMPMPSPSPHNNFVPGRPSNSSYRRR